MGEVPYRMKSLVRLTYKEIHEALRFRDDIDIEAIFITDSDNMAERITVKLSKGPCECPDGSELVMVPLIDVQKVD